MRGGASAVIAPASRPGLSFLVANSLLLRPALTLAWCNRPGQGIASRYASSPKLFYSCGAIAHHTRNDTDERNSSESECRSDLRTLGRNTCDRVPVDFKRRQQSVSCARSCRAAVDACARAGQAQPYYQGDPLPVMQSAAAPTPNSLLTGDSAAARTATGKTLAWNSPASTPQSASVAAQPAQVSPWPPVTQSPAPIACAPENAVSVPADTASLRFPMQPTVQPTPTSQIAVGPSQQAPTSINTAAVPNQGVMLASYNVPASNASSVPTAAPANPNFPWRTPQYNGITPTSGYPQQAGLVPPISPQPSMSTAASYPMAQAPITLPTNPMAVDLRR